jgi:hypothetical protein
MSLKILCGMRIVCGTRCRENPNTFDVKHILLKNCVYELIIKNMPESHRHR